MRYNLFSLLLLSICCLLAACSDDEPIEEPQYDKHAPHTLLLYLNGDSDSNMKSFIQQNANDAHAAIKDSLNVGALNLVIFHDNNRTAKLYWIHKNSKQSLDTICLKEYDVPVNSCSKKVLKEVLDITFNQTFKDSRYKGMVFGGHALGWTPSDGYKEPVASTRQIGIDYNTGGTTGYLELWDFCDALKETNTKLNYLFFDACNMGNIEVAYQLRGLTDYMVGAPTEILGKGFPYKTVIKKLGSCTNESQFEDALDNCIDAYYYNYSTAIEGASISLIDVRNVETFYNDFFSLLNNSPKLEELQELLANGDENKIKTWQRQFQPFGRSEQYSEYYFYDLEQFVEYIAPEDSEEKRKVINDIELGIVPINYYTDVFFKIPINVCCGITISYPQCLKYIRTKKSNSNLMSAYRRTDWGAEMLRVLNY